MVFSKINSDIIYIRSDYHKNKTTYRCLVTQAAHYSGKTTLDSRPHAHSWFSGGELQALRQGGLQVHAGKGARAQVLPHPVPGQGETGYHLCTTSAGGQGSRLQRQLSETASSSQRVRRHQQRTLTAQRSILAGKHGRTRILYRYHGSDIVDCQYAGTILARRHERNRYQGGTR